MSGPAGAGVRSIFVDHSGYHLANVGDAAMLQAAVARLRARFPGARIHVVTYFPERLERLCPGTVPVHSRVHRLAHRYGLPAKAEYGAAQALKILAPRWPLLAPAAGRIERAWGRGAPGDPEAAPRDLLPALAEADLVVAAGGGYLTDAFRIHALGVLNVLRMARARGRPTALMGQGIGPIDDPRFAARVARELRGADVLALREGLAGPALVQRWGVDEGRWLVTGDDGVEAAHALRPERPGDAIGVNVRLAGYAGLRGGDAGAGTVGTALRRVADAVQARLVALPISYHREDADLGSIRRVVGEPLVVPPAIETLPLPSDLMREVARCRVVVTGSYHAGVFAAAQGIPVVGLSRSGYYDAKFAGLRHAFGNGVRVVRLDAPDLEPTLRAAVREAWARADEARAPLLAAARRQIAWGHEAYDRLVAAVVPAGRGRPGPG